MSVPSTAGTVRHMQHPPPERNSAFDAHRYAPSLRWGGEGERNKARGFSKGEMGKGSSGEKQRGPPLSGKNHICTFVGNCKQYDSICWCTSRYFHPG